MDMEFDPFDLLEHAWQREKFTPDFARVTAKLVADIPPTELAAAVLHLARTHSTWRPDGAMIRATVVELRGLFPSEGQAARQARMWGRFRQQSSLERGASPLPTMPACHPVVRLAYDAAGIEHEPTFRAAYRTAVAEESTRLQAGSLVEVPSYTPVCPSPNREPIVAVWVAGDWAVGVTDAYTALSGPLIRPQLAVS